ncbi:cytochrome P450 26B1-like [Alosa alosa]|uniref:cytochrome P450 26B1-like n=1 Tax=Alosa alosa TaxID=278164 RepID=UPI0020152D00|nr:cytochrome P450 26B1-like [Alosa alosa]
MNLFELGNLSFLATAIASILSVVLLVAISQQLWTLRWSITRDRDSDLPLPKGSMGWPVVGETLDWLFQGSNFHVTRREKYGNVFKTHLLGKPVIRVTGAENIRKILMGEHSLVCTQWPQSTRIILGPNTLANSVGELHKRKRKILAQAFSHVAFETYLPRLQDVIKREVAKWCSEPGCIDVYAAAKALTFRIAVQVLLGLDAPDAQMDYLSKTFEQLTDNLFSLPIDVSFSGLRKGMKARDILHNVIEKMIEEKLQKQWSGYNDAFDYILSSAKENHFDITLQELKETAVELIFAAHATTASASTSLILLLLLHPSVALKSRGEIESSELGHAINRTSAPRLSPENSVETSRSRELEAVPVDNRNATPIAQLHNGKVGPSYHLPHLTLEKLSRMRYLDCVVKEVLRLFPPVSGGYRTVLKTFELDGCQIPKGWSVMYSIRDTHETAPIYQCPEQFDPERFGPERDEVAKGGRFSYVPFGGGVRGCVGKELAQVIIKTLATELLATTEWRMATTKPPRMQTVPVVHPVNGLHVHFNYKHP